MMTYKNWMKETKRGLLTPRSKTLKAIDKAFENLDMRRAPNNEMLLVAALKAWLDTIGFNWKQSTRNSTKVRGKGTVERLLDDLTRSPLARNKLAKYVRQTGPTVLTPKIIVFSGHGSWEVTRDNYVKLPAKCSIKFYTMNMRTLSDGLGGDIDRGIVTGLEPDQEAGPYSTIPDMRLFPPHGLTIKRPNPATWQVVRIPDPVPSNSNNLQIQIKNGFSGGATISVMLDYLRPAIESASSVIFFWAACRASGLADSGGEFLGVDAMQR
jgi:hypothetical protein